MLKAGILSEPEPFELIGGELVAMAAKDRPHEVLRTELALFWGDRRGDLKIASETPLRLGDYDEPEPDLIVFPASLQAPDVRADTVLLVVEVADSSLPVDLNTKAPRYAAAGVREYWVINARTCVTTVFREPRPSAEYGHRRELGATEMLVPMLAPSLGVRLADLGLAEISDRRGRWRVRQALVPHARVPHIGVRPERLLDTDRREVRARQRQRLLASACGSCPNADRPPHVHAVQERFDPVGAPPTIVAIVRGPIKAVETTRANGDRREKRRRQFEIGHHAFASGREPRASYQPEET